VVIDQYSFAGLAIVVRLFFENARLFFKECMAFQRYFQTFSEKLRLFLFNRRVFPKLQGILSTVLVELRIL
jgi:hypothetical protein